MTHYVVPNRQSKANGGAFASALILALITAAIFEVSAPVLLVKW